MQGFNMGRYIPPDLEGRISANQASGKTRASGSLGPKGILTVRFELPFPVWCTNCRPEQIIGQGVRFNTAKKKVGNYYSTAVWSFRFKHIVCGGWIEVRTDPKNAEYVVTEGGRRRDEGKDKLLDGEVRVGVSEADKERWERDGGFADLEKKVVDTQLAMTAGKRIDGMRDQKERDWADPYERNRELRREFRVGRKKRDEERRTGEEIRDRFGLGVEMVPGTVEDGVRAGLVEFGNGVEFRETRFRPLFDDEAMAALSADGGKNGAKVSAADRAASKKDMLQKKLSGNSKAVVDPFLREEKIWAPRAKRKKTEDEPLKTTQPDYSGAALVGYDSESS